MCYFIHSVGHHWEVEVPSVTTFVFSDIRLVLLAHGA